MERVTDAEALVAVARREGEDGRIANVTRCRPEPPGRARLVERW
jgi:hypothetical protein